MNARDLLSSLVTRSGLLFALERAPRRPGLMVFNYHRVGSTAGNPFDDGVFSATADQFREQVRFIQRRFHLASMAECLAAAERGWRFDRPTALITFDDGYLDNYAIAAPILNQLRAPATFFIATDFIQSPRITWWDRIAYVLKQAQGTFTLTYPADLHVDPAAPDATRRVLRLFKRTSDLDERRFFEELESNAGVSVDDRLADSLFMTWDHLRELLTSGHTIGSHTQSHRILSHLDQADQRQELTVSKRILEDQLNVRIDTLAYPVGGTAAFNATTRRVAAEAGYRMAFSYYGGINRSGLVEPFDVRRVAVDADVKPHRFRSSAVFYSAFGSGVFA